MDELKPCPFCGYEAEISKGRFDGKATSYVMCKKCAARGEFFFVSPKYSSDDRAIKAWNRRTGEQKMTKAETIEYAIQKECERFSLEEWCENWDITVDEFHRFLELGRKAFEGEQE